MRWIFCSFFWDSGRTSTQSARMHRPENCLQGSGAVLHEELSPTIVEIGGIPHAFRTYLFDRNGTTVHVFYLIWRMVTEMLFIFQRCTLIAATVTYHFLELCHLRRALSMLRLRRSYRYAAKTAPNKPRNPLSTLRLRRSYRYSLFSKVVNHTG